jgi:hypothetical protein
MGGSQLISYNLKKTKTPKKMPLGFSPKRREVKGHFCCEETTKKN